MGIKFLEPSSTIQVVSMQDDAIDKENTDMVEYAKTYDFSLLKFLPGEQPTIFIVKNVMSIELVSIQQDHYIAEIPEITPDMTLEQMKNNKITVKPVKTGEMLVKYFKGGCESIIINGKKEQLTDALLNTVPPMVLQELGSFIMMRSMLTNSKKKL